MAYDLSKIPEKRKVIFYLNGKYNKFNINTSEIEFIPSNNKRCKIDLIIYIENRSKLFKFIKSNKERIYDSVLVSIYGDIFTKMNKCYFSKSITNIISGENNKILLSADSIQYEQEDYIGKKKRRFSNIDKILNND